MTPSNNKSLLPDTPSLMQALRLQVQESAENPQGGTDLALSSLPQGNRGLAVASRSRSLTSADLIQILEEVIDLVDDDDEFMVERDETKTGFKEHPDHPSQ